MVDPVVAPQKWIDGDINETRTPESTIVADATAGFQLYDPRTPSADRGRDFIIDPNMKVRLVNHHLPRRNCRNFGEILR